MPSGHVSTNTALSHSLSKGGWRSLSLSLAARMLDSPFRDQHIQHFSLVLSKIMSARNAAGHHPHKSNLHACLARAFLCPPHDQGDHHLVAPRTPKAKATGANQPDFTISPSCRKRTTASLVAWMARSISRLTTAFLNSPSWRFCEPTQLELDPLPVHYQASLSIRRLYHNP